MSNDVLLSICIPTYNRSAALDKTITSIVNDPLFNEGQVELVISDNCSTDDTRSVAKKYQEQYKNIIYHCNEKNIVDANFVTVLSLGKGTFLKLYNDNATFLEGTLEFLLSTAQKSLEKKPVLCFPNAALPHISIKKKECKSFQEFIDTLSFYSTWIGSFGIWKDDFDRLTDIYRAIPLHLWQVDILFRTVAQKQFVVVYNQKLVEIQNIQGRGGYNVFEIFADNYLSLYHEYLDNGMLSKTGFRREKRRLFYYYFLGWMMKLYVKKNSSYDFYTQGGNKILFKHYKTYPVYYLGMFGLLCCKGWYYLKAKVTNR